MGLHLVAQHIKQQGRGPDDQLIHMTAGEVAGLQALAMRHGGSLTTNPKTGLPEAGFLSDILPTVLGAAGMYMGIDPMTTAAVVGGLTGASSGSLSKGLTAGLGAYGGANMTGSLMGVGNTMLDMGGSLPAGGASNAQQFGAGVSALGDPNVGKVAALGGWGTIGQAATPLIAGMIQPQTAQAPQGTDQMIRPHTFAYNPQTVTNAVGTQYAPGQDTSERMWFKPAYTAQEPYKAAQGGLLAAARMAGGGTVGDTQYPLAQDGDMPVDMRTGDPIAYGMAQGGMTPLGDYAAHDNPHLLKGPGDGMSDSIPAVIGVGKPARLTDGEFVVPADVVSGLGNGSTNAGAKQLYKMLDKVRASRTGKKTQARTINPNKMVPA